MSLFEVKDEKQKSPDHEGSQCIDNSAITSHVLFFVDRFTSGADLPPAPTWIPWPSSSTAATAAGVERPWMRSGRGRARGRVGNQSKAGRGDLGAIRAPSVWADGGAVVGDPEVF
jgi:hypothetical protein